MTFIRFAIGVVALWRLLPLTVFAGSDDGVGSEDAVQVTWRQPRASVYQGERFPLSLRVTHPPSITLTHIKVAGLPVDEQVILSPFERLALAGQRDDRGETVYRSLAVVLNTGPRKFSPVVDYIATERRIHDFFRTEHRETAGRITLPVLTVDVKAWPLEGQPPTFHGVVGQFDMRTRLDTEQPVTPGTILTLRTTISGEGNVERLTPPQFSAPPSDAWRIYDARRVESTGNRCVFERSIVPMQVGETTLPALITTWFDPHRNIYVSQTNGPFTVHVNPFPDDIPPFNLTIGDMADSDGTAMYPLKPCLHDYGPVLRRLRRWAGAWGWWVPVLLMVIIAGLRRGRRS